MLKIIDSTTTDFHDLTIDGSVPFSLHCRKNHGSTLYWSGRNRNVAMIEVGFDSIFGNLNEVTAVFYQTYKRTQSRWQPKIDNAINALPICDISAWGDCENDFYARYRTEAIEFEVIIGLDFASFVLLPESKVHTFYAVDRVLIGANEDGVICEFSVVDLSPEEVELVIPPSAVERTTS